MTEITEGSRPANGDPHGRGVHADSARVARLSWSRLKSVAIASLIAVTLSFHPDVAFGQGSTTATADLLLPGDEAVIVTRALAGEDILLGPGTFLFEAGWRSHISHAVRGAGREATLLVFEAPADQERAAIVWDGPELLAITDLSIQWTVDSGVTVGVLALSGQVNLQDVLIRGSASPVSEGSEVGVAYTGDSTGHIVGTRLESFGNSAVSLLELARVQVEQSELEDNQGVGLRVGGNAVAIVTECSISHNGEGIIAEGEAWFTVLTSRIASNTGTGVLGQEDSSGLITDSVIEDNGRTALAGQDSFWLTVVRSTIRRNLSGLATFGANPTAKYAILGNTFEGNVGHAATSSTLASIAVVGNTFVDNGLDTGAAALVFSVASRGSAVDNVIQGNGGTGILCLERSVAPLLENVLAFNGEYGIHRGDGSRCREYGSEFEGNAKGDMEVWRAE